MTHPTRWTPPEWTDAPECQECDGTGSVLGVDMYDRVFRECPECHGTGRIPAADAPDRDTIGDEKYHQAVDDAAERRGK